MDIKDLQPKQGNAEVTAEVVEKGEIREFQKFGKAGRVCNAQIKDGTGDVKLTLWNEQIDQVQVGDKIKITNGYVNEWQGEKQLTTGKFGKLEVLESKGATSNEENTNNKDENTLTQDEVVEEEIEEEKVE